MIKITLSMLTVVILGFGAGIVGGADPMADKEANRRWGSASLKTRSKAR